MNSPGVGPALSTNCLLLQQATIILPRLSKRPGAAASVERRSLLQAASRVPIVLDLADEARPQVPAATKPLPGPADTPLFPAPATPGAASVAFMGLQVAKPAQRGAGVRLVRQPKGRLMAAKTVIPVEQAAEPQAVDAGPEV